MAKNILHTIEKNMGDFSKGQKLIARFILEDYDKAAFMTASKLGKTVQVSESTVVRFATQLGYDGYPSMQRALQEMIRGKLTSIQRIQASDGTLTGANLVTNVMQRDIVWWTRCLMPSAFILSDSVRLRFWRAISTSICA